MRIAIGIGGGPSTQRISWQDTVEFVAQAERLGVDFAWSAEAWGWDAVSPLAYVAARTSRIRLGTAIMQISARAPVMTAMTALTLDTISGGRFVLGLGTSGPQVVEGLHGVPFAHPLGRLRETVEIVRMALCGERVVFDGQHYHLPRPGGEGKPLRLAHEPRPRLPIYLATLAPKSLELTGELADGWLGTSFIPEQSDVFLDAIRTGAQRAGRSMEDIDIQVGGDVEFGDDIPSLAAARKPRLAFTLGAMGSRKHNFYNEAFCRAGYAQVAREAQRLWLEKRRGEAAALIPDAMVLGTNLIGPESMVRERIAAYRAAGVTTLRLTPAGSTLEDRVATLARAIELIRELDEVPRPG